MGVVVTLMVGTVFARTVCVAEVVSEYRLRVEARDTLDRREVS